MISIELASKKDISGVYALECECFSDPWSEKMLLEDLENPHTVYLVARDSEKVIGYAGVWCVAGDGDITNVAVSKNYRRQGIAGMLLERLFSEAIARDTKNIRLEVRESNVGAIALYEKHGFFKIDTRKKYYRDNGEDAFIMEKILAEEK